jgi:probable addiction module antidote protein
MRKPFVKYEDGLNGALKNDEEAAAYLNAALEDGSQENFLLALRDVAESRGISRLAKEAALNRENLYRILSGKGNPQFSSLNALLDSLGFRLSIELKNKAA